jgi:hypothetical protein
MYSTKAAVAALDHLACSSGIAQRGWQGAFAF